MKKISVMMFHPDKNPVQGQSRPLFITGNDGNDYFLKRQNVYINGKPFHEDSVFLQESLAYQLAEILKIPVPNYAIVDIDGRSLECNKQTQFNSHLLPGKYFATEIIPENQQNIINNNKISKSVDRPRYNEPLPSFFKKISNKDIFPKLIAFDLFLLNFDRFGNDGNFVVARKNNTYSGIAIDFGHSFAGPKWGDLNKQHFLTMYQSIDYNTYINNILRTLLKSNGYNGIPFSGLGPVFNAMEQNIYFQDSNPFLDIVLKIQDLTKENFCNCLDNIPSEWYVDEIAQKKVYLEFMMYHKDVVQTLIDYLYKCGAFSNNLGGSLKWRKNPLHGIQ